MASIHMIWADEPSRATVYADELAAGRDYTIIHAGRYATAQAEDLILEESLSSEDACFCMVFRIKD